MQKCGFRSLDADPCIFNWGDGNKKIFLALYVDDGIIAAANKADIDMIVDCLRKEFQINVCDAEYFLGIELIQLNSGILLRQSLYATQVLSKFKMDTCKEVSTPMDNNVDNFANSEEVSYPYREAIGNLMYLATVTRPDIAFAVGVLSRFMEKPKKIHMHAVQRIMRYIKTTIDYGIFYSVEESGGLVGYSDADYAGDCSTRRSTSGCVFTYNGGVISWSSEIQKSVALSTTESEYIAACHAIKELVWLQSLKVELTGENEIVEFNMDNQSAIRLIKNPEYHKRTKHIDVRYHFIREKYEEGLFLLKYVPTDEQLADIFTKSLLKGRFQLLRSMLNIIKN